MLKPVDVIFYQALVLVRLVFTINLVAPKMTMNNPNRIKIPENVNNLKTGNDFFMMDANGVCDAWPKIFIIPAARRENQNIIKEILVMLMPLPIQVVE
jgi:hypothetical protein